MIELLAPAGDLEKLKIAIMYGADAVFIGGENFSLRKRASNFTLEDIKNGCLFAHEYHKKVYVTVNIIPHSANLLNIDEYLKVLESFGVDGLICSSPYICKKVLELTNIPIHISTQNSVTNSLAITYYEQLKATRVVLAREVSLDEMLKIRKHSKLELEVFIHGGMCSSYSGRCILSNEMANRDANIGGCAHSCRWNYDLLNENKINRDGYFSLSSKDLMALKMIPKLIELDISSLKIEGRMKSIHYIATVVKNYRMLIDDYYAKKEIDFNYYFNRIKKAENRLTSVGFFLGEPTENEQLYENHGENPTQEFVALVIDSCDDYVIIEQRNYFTTSDQLELFSPNQECIFRIDHLYDLDGFEVFIARHPKQVLKFKTKLKMTKYDIIRKISNESI